jgi:hypothetical protein
MNCENCLAQIDEYLDGKLTSPDCADVKEHLENCLPCARLSAELSAILDCCVETREYLESPPNPQALWLRISNIVECEQSVLAVAQAKTNVSVTTAASQSSLWTRNWQLSMQQMVSGVLGIAVITSLLTIISVQNAFQSKANPSSKQSGLLSSLLGDGNQIAPIQINNENRVRQQEIAIEYWNQRVESRKNQWNRHLRDAFDRNLHEIDAVVADYRQQLQINPDDKISEEMLDSALNDKTALLRDFSEL